MSETKHTPGPWLYAGPAGMGILINAEPRPICVVYGPNDAEIPEANARLIAAAPELLEALTELLNQLHETRKNQPEAYLEFVNEVVPNAEAFCSAISAAWATAVKASNGERG